MRPRRRVVVLERDEVSRRIRCFVLDLWGFMVFPAADARAAGRLLRTLRMDVVIAVLPGERERRALLRGRRESDFRILSLDPKAGARDSIANVSLSARCKPMELRAALVPLARRKRGPKKRGIANK